MITDIVSFDGTTFSPDYEVGFVTASEPRLPGASVQSLERIGAWPVIAALQRKPHRLALVIRIAGSSRNTLRSALFRLFDPEDETPKKLLAANHDGTQMYVYALCEDLRVYGDQQHDIAFVVTLAVDGDVRWRAESATSDTWNITASGQTRSLNNAGEDEVYPVYKVEPTTAKTGGYAYRRWVPVVWRSENAGSDYPLLATMDTATPVGAGKMQADGDDLRVLVDGLEVNRWLDAMNGASTKIWFSASFARAPSLTLKTEIAAAGDIASIEFNEETEVALLPESGILLIDDEAFVYTARILTDAVVTGITRAAKGTSMALHTVGDTVHWIQHDVYVLYGNAAASAPEQPLQHKPAFELDHSDNETWEFEWFGRRGMEQPGSWYGWGPISKYTNSGRYTATGREIENAISVLGAWRAEHGDFAQGWYLQNPCGIVNAAWADGKHRAVVRTDYVVHLMYWVRGASWWTWQKTLDDPAVDNTWENWSEAAAVADWDAAETLAIALYAYSSDVEAGTVTVSLLATEVPVVSVNAEQGNYELSCTLTNETTGEAITVEFVMDLDSELEIDTDARTVTWLEDDSGQFQVLGLSSARRHWLRLLPGSNTLRFDDTGTGNVTVTTTWRTRYY